MALAQEIKTLITKDIVLEWRQRYALNGMILYIVSTVVVCYMSFNLQRVPLNVVTWNALFWIILLFTSVNAIAKSFMQERQGRHLYYYTLVSPQAIILSKIIYNTLFMLLLSGIGLLVYGVVLNNPVQDMPLFLLNLALGSMGFASTLTMISGIASKANNNSTLMAVLSFPVIIPMLLMLIKVSKNALDGLERASSTDEIVTLLAINAIVLAVSYILFPYLWRS
ncbi:heme exporter protein B [Flexibacter flexilis DSM 6793]|uniref:Heme exporter protein B n=1 Tax=Flexibacter flexilis DSM 6793 TaxID=927664 RepID=A0A1I1G1F3_9BACT|nr:heme exporter protein CcmB [Flexibacter flexilis]SFC05112.1 heme exporter protein B [Flexibacter flexilis DSM 6793]